MQDSKAFLSFSIGPVQSFIGTARSVRDLWTGSYILSWLCAHAAKTLLENHELKPKFIEPDISDNPILKFLLDKGNSDNLDQRLIPTLPNRFIVEGDANHIAGTAQCVEEAVRKEWRKISECVYSCLKNKWDDNYEGWDAHCNEQIENCWDLRVSLLPQSENDIEKAKYLGFRLEDNLSPDDANFMARMLLLSRLDAAHKQIRHYPQHEPKDCHLPKCALCGERSQQIPQKEWDKAAGKTSERGERLTVKDRFCAVELVKRFAWAHYFSKEECFKCDYQKRRVWDTYTIAASGWLSHIRTGQTNGKESAAQLWEWLKGQVDTARGEEKSWNGAWLSWNGSESPDKDEYDSCPEPIWKSLMEVRNSAKKKNISLRPPSYYAILMLDGDKMGEKLSKANENKRRDISKKLADFAMKDVPDIVRDHLGQLIYAGGDDVLAMLPRETALDCAHDMSQKFSGRLPGFTLSGGIAVVHVKHDLRDALNAARAAEKKAKDVSRNRLALCIIRRSGEPETAVIRWDQVKSLENLRKKFTDPGISDRWLYQFADEWDTLKQDCSMLDLEYARLLKHSEKAPKDEAEDFWKAFTEDPLEERSNALTLMQHASFLARATED